MPIMSRDIVGMLCYDVIMTNDLPDSRPMDLDRYQNSHDYSTWRAGSTVTLCNVPWDSTYRDIVRFETPATRAEYFGSLESDSESVVLTRQTMVRFGEPIKIAMPFDASCRYNYAVVSYGRDNNSRPWFYFIQDVKWAAGGVTELYLMLDVWTSFQFDITFGRCYVERGHVGIAQKINNDTDIRNFLTVPEGLDVGAHYSTMGTRVTSVFLQNRPASAIVVMTTDLSAKWPSADNADSLKSARGANFDNFATGADVYLVPDANDLREFLGILSDFPLVSQSIINITIIPTVVPDNNFDVTWITSNDLRDGLVCKINSRLAESVDSEFFRVKDFRSGLGVPKNGLFAMLNEKLSTYPYSVIEITMYNGQTLVINPENVVGDDLVIRRIGFLNQPSPRMVFYVANYNSWDKAIQSNVEQSAASADFLDTALVLDNFPTTNVVNNSTIAYMTSNRASIRWAYQNADWSQQKTQLGIQQSSAQTAQGNQFRNQQNDQRNTQAGQRTLLHNAETGVMGATSAVGSLASGNVGGAVAGVVGTGEQIVSNSLNNSQNMRFNTQNTQLANRQATQANDLNTQYAAQAMQGDYANQVAGINAKVQDAQLLEPSVSGQVGGDAFNYVALFGELAIKFKRIQENALNNIGEFWCRYGYNIQRFMTPPEDLQVMTKATYWKMSETFLESSSCPEPYRMTIRGIFEKGVTVYRNPSDIGTLNFENQKPIKKVWYA